VKFRYPTDQAFLNDDLIDKVDIKDFNDKILICIFTKSLVYNKFGFIKLNNPVSNREVIVIEIDHHSIGKNKNISHTFDLLGLNTILFIINNNSH